MSASDISPKKAPQSIAKATGSVAGLTLCSRVLGFIRDIIIASFFGAGLASDAFFVAFKIPNLLRRLVAEGSMSVAFVPIFSDELAASKQRARSAIAAVTAFALLLTILLSILGVIFAEEIALLFAPGFAAVAGKLELAASLLQLMFPYIIMVTLLALCTSVLNTLGYFALPAAAPALLNISIIGTVIVCASFFELNVYSLAIGVLLGGLFALWPQLLLLRQLGFPLLLQKSDPDGLRALGQLVRLMIPAVLSASVYQLMIFMNTLLASMLRQGSVSWLYYADRVFQFPLGVFSLAIAQAILPFMARDLSGDGPEEVKRAQMKKKFVLALDWITLILIPASVGLFILADDIVVTLFMRGSFDATSATNTAIALQAYAIGLWPIGMQSTFVRAYLAQKNTLTPALISFFTLVTNLVLAIALMGPVTEEAGLGAIVAPISQSLSLASLGHVGLALALSISSYLTVFFLVLFLPSINMKFSFREIWPTLPKTLLASAGMLAVLLLVQSLDLIPQLRLILAILAGMLSFFLLASALKVSSLLKLISSFKKSSD